MELSLPLVAYETLAAAVLSARPTVAGDGVDITGWRSPVGGAYSFVNCTGYIQKVGADVTVTKLAASNAQGVEVWGMKAKKSGTSYWWLEGVLNGGSDIIVAGAGGFSFPLVLSTIFDRLAIVGTSSDGAHIPNFFFEPIEHIMQFVC